ncbi:MAG: hypothetical protein AB7U79_07100 [Candidatus Izemoplasmatales bacterium]
MKKFLVLVVLCVLASGNILFVEAKHHDEYHVSEKAFVYSEIDSIVFDGNGTVKRDSDFTYVKKEKVYDIFLNSYGNVYSFGISENIFGFIIVRKVKVEGEWIHEVAEVSLGVDSPFKTINAKNIYLSYSLYFEYDGLNLIDCSSNQIYSYDYVLKYYSNQDLVLSSGGSTSTPGTEEYPYYLKTVISNVEFENGYPMMSTSDVKSSTTQTNNCNPTAGVSVIMFWDKLRTDLIPSFVPYRTVMVGIPPYSYHYEYPYKNWSDLSASEIVILRDLHTDLYDSMNTNNWYLLNGSLGPFEGTYPPDFYDAMEDYFSDSNYTLQHEDIIGGTNTSLGIGVELDTTEWNMYKDEIDDEHPVIISLGVDTSADFTFYNGNYTDITDGVPDLYTIYGTPYYYHLLTEEFVEYSNSAHMVVGYGYKEVKYYKIDLYGNLYHDKTDQYFIVANGWGGTSYIKNATSDISIAYSLYVQ